MAPILLLALGGALLLGASMGSKEQRKEEARTFVMRVDLDPTLPQEAQMGIRASLLSAVEGFITLATLENQAKAYEAQGYLMTARAHRILDMMLRSNLGYT